MLQTAFWGAVKSRFGWKSILIESGNQPVRIFIRSIASKLQFVYIPYGYSDVEMLETDIENLIQSIKKVVPRAIFVRFDLADCVISSVTEGIDRSYQFAVPEGFKKSSDIQPPDTVILSLDEKASNPDQILAGMHKKTRYNIRLSEKKGVVFSSVDSSRLPQWYELYKETAVRDKIAIHSLEYYQAVFDLAKESDEVSMKLFFAEHEGELLAGIIVGLCRDQAYYIYGASSNAKRNLMPSYGLQWFAINDVLTAGAKSYDFFGIPPADDPSHPMHGLYRFKCGFGGELIHRAGAWDLPLKKGMYGCLRLAERLRLFYYKRVKKR